MNNFVNEQKIDLPRLETRLPIMNHNKGIVELEALLTIPEISIILSLINSQTWVNADRFGKAKPDLHPDKVMSGRLSIYSEAFASDLWARIRAGIPAYRYFDEFGYADHDDHEKWKPIGINPLLRFIRYNHGQYLVPHYDGPWIENDRKRTLQSLVIYLEGDAISGTRFLKDPQNSMKFSKRNFSDQDRVPMVDEIIRIINASSGNAVIFDHRRLHDSMPVQKTKTIIRTDILFEKC